MGLFDSIFGIDITGDGKADMLDDAIILEALDGPAEGKKAMRAANGHEDDWDDEDDAIASGAIDEFLGF